MNKQEIVEQLKGKIVNILAIQAGITAQGWDYEGEKDWALKQINTLIDKALTQYSDTLREKIEGMKKEMVSVQESDEDYNRHGNREFTRGWNHIRTGYNQSLQDVLALLSQESGK